MNSLNISIAISGLIILFLCSAKFVTGSENTVQMPSRPIEEVLKEHSYELMSIPGVVGIAQGICNNESCIKVFVTKKTKEIDQRIPDELDGYPVFVEETGEFKALPQT
jgi:hypothetical protein